MCFKEWGSIKLVRNEIFNFKNRAIVETEDIILPNNNNLKLFRLRFLPFTVSILPLFTKQKSVVLIKQYRPAINKYIIEVPAGVAEKNEIPEEVAKRELKEETGLLAKSLIQAAKGYVSPGYSTEYMYYYVALDPDIGLASPESTEIIEPIKLKLDEAIKLIERGEIEDSKTILLLFYAKNNISTLSQAI